MRLVTSRLLSLLAASSLVLAASTAYAQVKINEIRTDNTGTDTDEYFELKGPANMSLSGYTYLVIGDGSSGTSRCGWIESVVNLSTYSLKANGILCLRNSGATPVLTGYDGAVALVFENSDNVTHMLVKGFTGANNTDLDTNDDGVLDVTPWTSIEDAVGLYTGTPAACATGSEYIYATTILGPDGSVVPGHVYRCADTDAWVIGKFTPLGTTDTPGVPNYSCAAPPPVFTNEARTPCVPQISEAATVTSKVRNCTGGDLYYAVNGGTETKVVMSVVGTSGDTTTLSAVIPGQAVNADRVSYYVRAFNATPDTTQDYSQGYFVGLVPISTLRVNDGVGAAIYRYYGARVRGTVSSGYGTYGPTNTDINIQDATGGINLFKYGTHTVQPVVGDDVTAAGSVDQYNGKLEIDAVGSCDTLLLTINGSGAAPTPNVVTTCGFGEASEDLLVRLSTVNVIKPDTVSFWVANKNYKVYTAACDTTTLFIDGDTNIPGGVIPATLTTLTGVGSQYDTATPWTAGYEIVPRNAADLVYPGAVPVGDAFFAARLGSPVPNPAGRSSRISFVIPGSTNGSGVATRLGVYDVQGRLLHKLVDGAMAPGEHSVTLDTQASGLQSNGIYFYRLEVGGKTLTRKLVVVR